VRTAAAVARHCATLGLDVRTGVGGTGVLAELDSGRPGPALLVRADMDALPVQEADDGRACRSTVPGVMHACGHDGHVAVALGVAEVLGTLHDRWSGRVRFCFQPAEEIDEGARRMIADSALEGIDRAVGLHLQAGLQTGTVAIGPGVQWAGSDELRIVVRGVGGHAGNPHDTVDPIAGAAELVLALERLSTAHAPALARVACIDAGTAANVVPETALLAGTMRAMGADQRELLLTDVEHAVGAIARARGARIELTLGADCPAVVCDPEATAHVRSALADVLPAGSVLDGEPSTYADDMGRYLEEVPGCYFRVGASDLAAGPAFPHHHPRFDLDERALPLATELLSRAALALLDAP
jgi:amidohydrolase